MERSNHLSWQPRNEWQEVIKNPAKENVISRSELRTVIGARILENLQKICYVAIHKPHLICPCYINQYFLQTISHTNLYNDCRIQSS